MRVTTKPVSKKTPNPAQPRQQPTARKIPVRMGIILLSGVCALGFVWAHYYSGGQRPPQPERPAPGIAAKRPVPASMLPPSRPVVAAVEQKRPVAEHRPYVDPPSTTSAAAIATTSSLRLKGTIVLPGSTANQAIMAAPGETEKVYVVGDRIADGAEVVEILPDRAVLRRQDRLEILRLSGTTLSASVSTMADPSPADDIDDITETDLGEVRAAIKIHPEMVLSLVEAEPTVENGQLRGFRVMPATDAVFMALLGLQPGDILSAINGILLDGEDRGQEQLRALAGASAFTFSVWRGDRPQLLTYNAAG